MDEIKAVSQESLEHSTHHEQPSDISEMKSEFLNGT